MTAVGGTWSPFRSAGSTADRIGDGVGRGCSGPGRALVVRCLRTRAGPGTPSACPARTVNVRLSWLRGGHQKGARPKVLPGSGCRRGLARQDRTRGSRGPGGPEPSRSRATSPRLRRSRVWRGTHLLRAPGRRCAVMRWPRSTGFLAHSRSGELFAWGSRRHRAPGLRTSARPVRRRGTSGQAQCVASRFGGDPPGRRFLDAGDGRARPGADRAPLRAARMRGPLFPVKAVAGRAAGLSGGAAPACVPGGCGRAVSAVWRAVPAVRRCSGPWCPGWSRGI